MKWFLLLWLTLAVPVLGQPEVGEALPPLPGVVTMGDEGLVLLVFRSADW